MRQALNIGLFGFGCVGQGLYDVLQKTPALQATISKIVVKHVDKPRSLPAHHFEYDPNSILGDERINVVVELIDDADAAFDLVCEALKRGKAVVTANKKMIAEHAETLLALQEQYGVPLLYEAACCASIPIIRNLEEYYDNDALESIEGIVNGSTNYILSKTAETGCSYDDALHDAQLKGYAESDPRLDTGGFDAKYKLVVLVLHAFGIVLDPNSVLNIGIDVLDELAINYAREKGLKIKLVAYAEKTASGDIVAYVLPKFIKSTDKLFHVDDVFNGIKTKTYFSDEQFFSGKGAGAYPTASAVLSDISALTYNYRYEYKKRTHALDELASPNVLFKVFIGFNPICLHQIIPYFLSIDESYHKQDVSYLIGVLTKDRLSQLKQDLGDVFSLVLFEQLEVGLFGRERLDQELVFA